MSQLDFPVRRVEDAMLADKTEQSAHHNRDAKMIRDMTEDGECRRVENAKVLLYPDCLSRDQVKLRFTAYLTKL